MAVKVYTIHSFQEYIEKVTSIGRVSKIGSTKPSVLWFRGYHKDDGDLQPTLLRDVPLKPLKNIPYISGRAIEEEVRKQHYLAKDYHFLSKDPKTSIE